MATRLETLPRLRPVDPGRTASPPLRMLGWLMLGFLAVAFTLVATWPATWVASTVAARSGQHVVLADASGSVWRGAATLVLSAGSGSQQATVLPGRLQWRLAPLALLRGHAVLTLTHDTALPAPLLASLTLQGWRSNAGVALLPAALLQGVGAPFNTLQPEGRMQVSWNALAGTRHGIRDGDITLRLDQLASTLSPIRPLGSYIAQLRWQNGQGNLSLATLTGPLLLEGAGTLGRDARFNGTARAAPEAAEALNALLSLMGRRDGDVTQLRF
jgi:general secretion pathway protein N